MYCENFAICLVPVYILLFATIYVIIDINESFGWACLVTSAFDIMDWINN